MLWKKVVLAWRIWYGGLPHRSVRGWSAVARSWQLASFEITAREVERLAREQRANDHP